MFLMIGWNLQNTPFFKLSIWYYDLYWPRSFLLETTAQFACVRIGNKNILIFHLFCMADADLFGVIDLLYF